MKTIGRAARLRNRVRWSFVLFLGLTMLGVKAFGAVPSITSQPQSRTHTCGVAATFNVTAAGDAPLTYQWRFNGVNLSGVTTASLTLNPVLPSQVGSYAVVISNGSGSVTSVVAQFVLTSPALVYVDDNYAGLADGMLVNFPSGAGGATYTIGCDAFANTGARNAGIGTAQVKRLIDGDEAVVDACGDVNRSS